MSWLPPWVWIGQGVFLRDRPSWPIRSFFGAGPAADMELTPTTVRLLELDFETLRMRCPETCTLISKIRSGFRLTPNNSSPIAKRLLYARRRPALFVLVASRNEAPQENDKEPKVSRHHPNG